MAVFYLMIFRQPFLSRLTYGDDSSKISTAVIRKNFDMLPIYPGDQWAGNIKSFDKGSITGVTGYLSTHASIQKIMDFYSERLKEEGWFLMVYKKSKEKGELYFCKDGMKLSVETHGVEGDLFYHYGITWSNSKWDVPPCGIRNFEVNGGWH